MNNVWSFSYFRSIKNLIQGAKYETAQKKSHLKV